MLKYQNMPEFQIAVCIYLYFIWYCIDSNNMREREPWIADLTEFVNGIESGLMTANLLGDRAL